MNIGTTILSSLFLCQVLYLCSQKTSKRATHFSKQILESKIVHLFHSTYFVSSFKNTYFHYMCMSVCLHLYLGNMYVQSLLRQEVGMEFPEMELQMVLS